MSYYTDTAQIASTEKFQTKTWDVTDTGCQILHILCCPIAFTPFIPGALGTKTLTLGPEEAELEYKCPCCNGKTRVPYGELGNVDRGNCLCCVGVASGLSKQMPICPGMGCDDKLVDEIVAEMKVRMRARGDTGQI